MKEKGYCAWAKTMLDPSCCVFVKILKSHKLSLTGVDQFSLLDLSEGYRRAFTPKVEGSCECKHEAVDKHTV